MMKKPRITESLIWNMIDEAAALLMWLFGQKKISQYNERVPQIAPNMASGKIESL